MLVDIHNHILPGLDDGPVNWEETILLAKQAASMGIGHVIATPHHKHHHKGHFYENNPKNIVELVHIANRKLQEHGVNVAIYPGIEFHLHEKILDDLSNKPEDFLTLNNTNKYMLMEPPSHHLPNYTDEVFERLQKMGFIPILAHPERNKVLRKSPEIIYKWVSKGVLVQITAGNLTGTYGKRLKNFSLHLLDHELVHFIGSDAHHYGRRNFELISAYEYIERNYSKELQEYLELNAMLALEGKEITAKQPQRIGKRRQYFFFYNHPLNTIKVSTY